MATLVLGNLHWKPAFEPLTRLLGDPVSEVRRCAALALGGFGEAKEGDWLLPLLKDPEEEVVKAARFALVELKDPRVLPHLVSALKDGPRHERDDILKAIGEVPDQSLVPLFIPMAKANTSIAAAATKVLAKLDCSKYPGDVVEIFRIRPSHSFGCEYKMVLKLGQSAEPFLIEALKDERRGVRFLSAELLGKVGTQKSVFPLIDLFGDRDSTVRERAEKALKELNSNNVSLEGTSERLLHLLDKKRYRMWDEPLAILRLTKDRQVIGTLIEKLNSLPKRRRRQDKRHPRGHYRRERHIRLPGLEGVVGRAEGEVAEGVEEDQHFLSFTWPSNPTSSLTTSQWSKSPLSRGSTSMPFQLRVITAARNERTFA
jgi:HEAT repeat protein